MTTLLILTLAVASTVHCGIVKRQIPVRPVSFPGFGKLTARPLPFPGQPGETTVLPIGVSGFSGGQSTVIPGVSGKPEGQEEAFRNLQQIAVKLLETIQKLQNELNQQNHPFVQQLIRIQISIAERILEAVNRQISQLGGTPVSVPSTEFSTPSGIFPTLGSSTFAPVTGFPIFPTVGLPVRM